MGEHIPRSSELQTARRGSVSGLRSGLLRRLVRPFQVRQFENAYRRAVSTIPGIRAVEFQDHGRWLSVTTVHEGDLDPVEDRIYELEAAMMSAFPEVHPDWHFAQAFKQEKTSHEITDDAVVAAR